MYLATVKEGKFIGNYFDPATITDQMITDAEVDGTTFVQVAELPISDENGDYGSPTSDQVTASVTAISNQQHRAYLDITDYYAVRLAETGKAMPDGVQIKRQAARDAIVD